ncbi:hypothetical protein JYT44_01865 [Caldithrix abyssi]|nr:hypothetical protein [Caldithrix abyssi]
MPDRHSPLITCIVVGINHAKQLPITFNSVHPLVDEILYVDLGSDDGSRNIAGEFDANVLEKRAADSPLEALQIAHHKAMGRWILLLDPAQELVTEDPNNVRFTVQNSESSGFFLPEYSLVDPADFFYQPLLYRKNGGKFEGKIFQPHLAHNPSFITQQPFSTALIEKIKVYHRDKPLREGQITRLIEGLERDLEQEPQNSRLYYYAAFYRKSLGHQRAVGNHVQAGIKILADCDVADLLSVKESTGLFGYYTEHLVNQELIEERLIQSLLELQEKLFRNPQFNTNLAILLQRIGRTEEALILLEEALALSFTPQWLTVTFYQQYIDPMYHFLEIIRSTKQEKDLLKIVLNLQAISTRNGINIRTFFAFLNDHHPDFMNLIEGILKRKLSGMN